MSESKTASLRDTFLLINFAVESALRSGLKIQLLLKIKYHMGVREKKVSHGCQRKKSVTWVSEKKSVTYYLNGPWGRIKFSEFQLSRSKILNLFSVMWEQNFLPFLMNCPHFQRIPPQRPDPCVREAFLRQKDYQYFMPEIMKPFCIKLADNFRLNKYPINRSEKETKYIRQWSATVNKSLQKMRSGFRYIKLFNCVH